MQNTLSHAHIRHNSNQMLATLHMAFERLDDTIVIRKRTHMTMMMMIINDIRIRMGKLFCGNIWSESVYLFFILKTWKSRRLSKCAEFYESEF